MHAPLAKGIDSLTGISHLIYNQNLNELLALGLDKRVTYYSVDKSTVTK